MSFSKLTICWRICGGKSSKGPTAIDRRLRILISCSVADRIIGARWGPGWGPWGPGWWGCMFWGAPKAKCLGGVPWRPPFWWWWNKCLGGSQLGSRRSIMLFCLAGMPPPLRGGAPPGAPDPKKGSMTSTFILLEADLSNFVLDRPLLDDSRLLFPPGGGAPFLRPPESVVDLSTGAAFCWAEWGPRDLDLSLAATAEARSSFWAASTTGPSDLERLYLASFDSFLSGISGNAS